MNSQTIRLPLHYDPNFPLNKTKCGIAIETATIWEGKNLDGKLYILQGIKDPRIVIAVQVGYTRLSVSPFVVDIANISGHTDAVNKIVSCSDSDYLDCILAEAKEYVQCGGRIC